MYLEKVENYFKCKCGNKAEWKIGKSVFCSNCVLETITENYKLIPKFKNSNGSLKDRYVEYQLYKEEIIEEHF